MKKQHGKTIMMVDEERQDLDSYAAGMDASVADKAAQISPYVSPGLIIDHGCGTGTLTKKLAETFPQSQIVGVELSPYFVRLARKNCAGLPNVRIEAADLFEYLCIAEGATTHIFSSVIHDVFSDRGYRKSAICALLKGAYRSLQRNGRIIIRDGVKPPPEKILLQLRADDGENNPNLDTSVLSTETMFRRFLRDFSKFWPIGNPVAHTERGVHMGVIVNSDVAYEFLMKKDYRKNWDAEIKEIFGYFTQEEFQKELECAGLKVVGMELIINPWILENRLKPAAKLFRENPTTGEWEPMDFFPTNILIVGEKQK